MSRFTLQLKVFQLALNVRLAELRIFLKLLIAIFARSVSLIQFLVKPCVSSAPPVNFLDFLEPSNAPTALLDRIRRVAAPQNVPPVRLELLCRRLALRSALPARAANILCEVNRSALIVCLELIKIQLAPARAIAAKSVDLVLIPLQLGQIL